MMVDINDAATLTRKGSNVMGEAEERPMAAIDIPAKVETEKHAAVDDDEDTSKGSKGEEQEAKTEKEGSLKDYFVGP
jgi:hypothetical protein